jgi:prepilin-type N-terminal cleavage/methylation domain-containing protein
MIAQRLVFAGRPRPAAFSLIELLVVIGLVGLLAGLLMPVLSRAQEEARKSNCRGNMSQAFAATRLYAHYSDGQLPDLYVGIHGAAAKCDKRYRSSHFATNVDSANATVACGLWLLRTTGQVKTEDSLWCPGAPGARRPGGSLNPYASGFPKMGGYAYNHTVGGINDITQTRSLSSYALMADVFLKELHMTHGSKNGLNVCYWDGSIQWGVLRTPLPWDGTEQVEEGVTKTFSDSAPGYAAVKESWAIISRLRR